MICNFDARCSFTQKNYAVCAINRKHSHVICAVSPRTHVCVGTQRKCLRKIHCMLVQVQADSENKVFVLVFIKKDSVRIVSAMHNS